jgi:phenylpyruvate tautomerase PptA (4-oxalocrotonate tautomerase family)
MPHIVIKTISGPTPAQLQEAAEQIAAVVNKTMGKPEKYISVSVEEYAFGEWEGVYNDCIKGKDNVLVKPGYSNPKTFS